MLGSTDAQITVHKSGSAVLTIQSKYNPDAVETANISVGILDSSHYDMSVSEESFVYDGTEHRPVVKLYKKGLAQEVSKDNYTVEYEGDLVNAGTVNVNVKGTELLRAVSAKHLSLNRQSFPDARLQCRRNRSASWKVRNLSWNIVSKTETEF